MRASCVAAVITVLADDEGDQLAPIGGLNRSCSYVYPISEDGDAITNSQHLIHPVGDEYASDVGLCERGQPAEENIHLATLQCRSRLVHHYHAGIGRERGRNSDECATR